MGVSHACLHTHMHVANMINMDASIGVAICNCYTCIHVRACMCTCVGTPPCPQTPPPHPPAPCPLKSSILPLLKHACGKQPLATMRPSAGVTPEVNLREGTHSGFETQRRHQKSKTGASVAPPKLKKKSFYLPKQQCIPVGCVSPTAVAISGGGVCLGVRCLPGGRCLPGPRGRQV